LEQKLLQGTNKKSFVVVNLVDILVENINVVQQNVELMEQIKAKHVEF